MGRFYPLYALQCYHPSAEEWLDVQDPAPSDIPHTYQKLEKEFVRLVKMACERRKLEEAAGYRVVVKWTPPKVGAVYCLWTNGNVPGAGEDKCAPI